MPTESELTVRGFTASDLVTEPLAETIDPDSFTPRLLALLSNALVWRESQEMRRYFGLGTTDWRVISALATRPGSTATEVSSFLDMNKAVVSKSVNLLAARELIVFLDGPRGSRPMYLTAAGAQMHADMLPLSTRGQEVIQEGMTAEEIEAFNRTLQAMLARIRAEPVAPGGTRGGRIDPGPRAGDTSALER